MIIKHPKHHPSTGDDDNQAKNYPSKSVKSHYPSFNPGYHHQSLATRICESVPKEPIIRIRIPVNIPKPIPRPRVKRVRDDAVGLGEAAGQRIVEAGAAVVRAGSGLPVFVLLLGKPLHHTKPWNLLQDRINCIKNSLVFLMVFLPQQPVFQ